MISIERALDLIRDKNIEEIREFSRNRILGLDVTHLGSGHSFEPSEDGIIQLLRNPSLGAKEREAVLQGCADVYRILQEWLYDVNWIEDVIKWEPVLESLCRVIDMSEPPELRKLTKLLVTGLLEEDCPPGILGSAIRAYMGFEQTEKGVRFWEDEILTRKDVAAYGFNALLDIDPTHARIETHLIELWRLQVQEDWPVNTAFLMRRAARIRGEEGLIFRVLKKLKREKYWSEIEKELGRPGKPWCNELLKEFQRLDFARYLERLSSEREVTKYGEQPKGTEIDLPKVTFYHGLDPESFSRYYGHLEISSHPSNVDWLDFVNRFLEKLSIKGRAKVKILEEHEDATEFEKV